MTIIKSVPTNIITGFLGVGKTTAILHLLKTKPANERWAILVNEFGEIGIDGELIAGEQKSLNHVSLDFADSPPFIWALMSAFSKSSSANISCWHEVTKSVL
jgi:hypothetical protein